MVAKASLAGKCSTCEYRKSTEYPHRRYQTTICSKVRKNPVGKDEIIGETKGLVWTV